MSDNGTAAQVTAPLSRLQTMCLAAWKQEPGAKLVIEDLLFDGILSTTAKQACCWALSDLNGTMARWPMGPEEARRLASGVSGVAMENMSYQEMRWHLREVGSSADGDKPFMSWPEIHEVVTIIKRQDDKGHDRIRAVVDLGLPCDGRHMPTTGSIVTGLLVRALWVAPDKIKKQVALSSVLMNFTAYLGRGGGDP